MSRTLATMAGVDPKAVARSDTSVQNTKPLFRLALPFEDLRLAPL
jgi:hypothetical protein